LLIYIYISVQEKLNNWRSEPVKLAVTGKTGVGKSSFINTIRNMKPGNYGFATMSCSGNTTEKATVYEYPGNPKITLHDLPGFGTIECPSLSMLSSNSSTADFWFSPLDPI
jgi:GTP-binding protein EngB required for normal cell division